MDNRAAQSYRVQEIMTASPTRLIALLYDRAITSLNEAIEAIAAGDIERRYRANNRAVEIIAHLAMTLDMEQGGQIAKNLDQLYRFMLTRLPQVDLRNDPKPAKEIIRLLEPIRASWHELATNGGRPGATAKATTPPSSPEAAPKIEISA